MFEIIGKEIGMMIDGKKGAKIGQEIGKVMDTVVIPIIVTVITKGKKTKI